MNEALRIKRLTAHVYRYPIQSPVVTSFGIMRDRPMVLVRAEDDQGCVGWGEIWCNFPAVGAEHRARLVHSVLAPILQTAEWSDPQTAFEALTARTAVLAIQSAEPGPFAQAIAGVDLALWDLHARRAGQSLAGLLGAQRDAIPVYASGINPDSPERVARDRHQEGYRAFKLKIGFGQARDLANLDAIREAIGDALMLMADVNQGWSFEQAMAAVADLERFNLQWLEEPLRADTPWPVWQRLADATNIALAGGENLLGDAAFDEALRQSSLAVIQPDVAKWGGITGCLSVARRALAAGRRYCPHWLGGGIGLLHSAHLLAAVGGDGLLEIDANPNPLRSLTCGPLNRVVDGHVQLDLSMSGIGFEPDLKALAPYAVTGISAG
jgi:L-alanine-DL-glutamate epimerase-like enolase superfamily enzyme